MTRCFVVVTLCALFGGCGGTDSPTAPGGLNEIVGGTWAGSVNDSISDPGTLRVTLSQEAAALTGSWAWVADGQSTGGWIGGSVNGKAISLSLHSGNPGTNCSVEVSATVASTKMSGTYAGINCPVSGAGRVDLTKQ